MAIAMAMAMAMDTWILRHKSTTVGSRDRLQHTEAEIFLGKHFKAGFSLVYALVKILKLCIS